MRNEHSRSHLRTRRTSSAARRDDLADWRCLTRPVILENFLDRTRDLCWSRELIDLLLDELQVNDEFDDLIGRVPSPAQVNYPQLVALALVLRYSWFPEDLARIIAEPGLSPSPTSPAVSRGPSSDVIDAANRRGLTGHSVPSRHASTPQKGDEQTC
jgi:hypothetical protein